MRISLLAGLAAAAQNANDECEGDKPCWAGAENKYLGGWPKCAGDVDCDAGHYCLKHMQKYNKDDLIAKGEGCTKREICQGSGTYAEGEEGRILQFFCTDE